MKEQWRRLLGVLIDVRSYRHNNQNHCPKKQAQASNSCKIEQSKPTKSRMLGMGIDISREFRNQVGRESKDYAQYKISFRIVSSREADGSCEIVPINLQKITFIVVHLYP